MNENHAVLHIDIELILDSYTHVPYKTFCDFTEYTCKTNRHVVTRVCLISLLKNTGDIAVFQVDRYLSLFKTHV